MPSCIQQINGPDERLILRTRLHWIYIVSGLCCLAAMAAIGYALDRLLWEYFGSSAPDTLPEVFIDMLGAPIMTLLFGGCGAVIFVLNIIKVFTNEIVLTTQRIIYKKGLIFVDVQEIDLIEIRAGNVHQGILGRFLNYGRLRLDSHFVGDITLPAVKNPYRLLKAMQTSRTKVHDVLQESQITRAEK